MGALSLDTGVGMAMRFKVVVDDLFDLGSWRECKGLNVTMDVERFQEGGNNQYEVILPKMVKYDNVVLTRAMTKKDSKTVLDWIAKKFRGADPGNLSAEGMEAAAMSMVPSLIRQFIPGSNAAVTLYDSNGVDVYTWTLNNAFPLKWEGPSLDGKATGIAEEKLTLYHEGFLDG